MAIKTAESSQPQVQQQQQQQSGDAGSVAAAPPSGTPDARSRCGDTIFKSGPLFISSKGIGWTSWKKRWFILTRTSLVFFRSDPSAVSQKGNGVNLTLGGIDLNNSGSVVVKADRKLLTVLFSDGRDGRAFTLKAETLEDLHEWKTALETALAQAPSASQVMGQNGILRNSHSTEANDSTEKTNDGRPVRSTIIGIPILLALEDVDGAPSFLEKALRFLEIHGVTVEGILRQAADVDDVERRIREYEQGKNEFAAEEDAHVIADCVKYVLRELPSSPVPASCCNALLEACRIEHGNRGNAMRAAICETFPEPNRCLLQRILMMMQSVASHKTENRMSTSAVAACMAPLLLRPLLAGDCEIDNDFDMGGDGSIQLLKAAAAANHAQAIVITLLEEYDSIFGEGSLSPDLYTDSEESGSESEEATEDEEYEDDESYDETDESEEYTEDDDIENESDGTCSEYAMSVDRDLDDHDSDHDEVSDGLSSLKESGTRKVSKKLSSCSKRPSLSCHGKVEKNQNISNKSSAISIEQAMEDFSIKLKTDKLANLGPVSCIQKPPTLSDGPGCSKRFWGRTPGKKNLSMESIDFPVEEEDIKIQTLEATKSELQNRIADEAKSNATLQDSLERRKKALHEHRLALEKDVERLQKDLQKERDTKAALEAGLNMSKGLLSVPVAIDEKVKKDLQEIAQTEADITKLEQMVGNFEGRLNKEHVKSSCSKHDSSKEARQISECHAKMNDKQKDFEVAVTHGSEKSTVKDTNLDARENESEKQQGSTTSPKKHSRQSQQQQQGVPCSNSKKSAGVSGNSSKRSGSKGEGGTSSTTSALSKLATRLNFLKERRSQIAWELQKMDKGRNSNQTGSPTSDINARSSSQTSPTSDKTRASENSHLAQDQEKGEALEGEPLKGKKSNTSKSNQDPGGVKRSEGQNPDIMDKGRSENNVSYNSDKSSGSFGGSRSKTTPRTFSR